MSVSHLEMTFLKQPPEEVNKKGNLKNFGKFKEKHLCQSLFFKKVKVKKETLTQLFSCEFSKFLRIRILKNICERLLLTVHIYHHLHFQGFLNFFMVKFKISRNEFFIYIFSFSASSAQWSLILGNIGTFGFIVNFALFGFWWVLANLFVIY